MNPEVAVPSSSVATLSLAQKLVAFAFVVAGLVYLGWRPTAFNWDAPILSVAVYAAEAFGFACACLSVYVCWALRPRRALLPLEGASVAILVPTMDEPVDVVRRTVMAAQRIQQATEVWLLDDGNRLEMLVLAEELKCRYLARPGTSHGKAGSLNNALAHTDAAFIAVFDADQAPAHDFLHETLGFFHDANVAFVQAASDFYNLDSFQHEFDRRESLAWHEQTRHHRVVQPGNDHLGAALFEGSCAVLRRKALVDVGGFATGTLASDLHTSIRLHKRGWTSVYYGRPLAFGRASTRLVPFLERCHRRVRGGMQVWRRERIAFARGLSLRQRAAYLSTVLRYLEGWQRLVLYVAPALVLATGALPIAQLDRGFVLRFVPYYLLACWVFDETTRGYGRIVLSERFRMIRFPTFVTAVAAFILPSAPGGTRSRGACDEAATKRALWPQYAVCAVNLVAIPLGMYHHVRGDGLPIGELLATALWAVVTAAVAALAAHKALRATIDRRREYRFPLPVPLRTRTPSGHETVALATDLSPLGCRIVGEPLGYARRGDELQGELLLPTGPLAVVASVRAITEPRSKHHAQPALACEFRWGLSEERNQLETFLYGSDLQWQLNGLTDRAPTLLERVAAWLGASTRVETRRLAGQTWSPVLYKRVNSEQGNGVGFISRSDPKTGARTIVSLGVLPRSGRLYAEEVTAAGPRGVVGRVEDEQVLETHAAPIYLYRLTA